MSRIKAKKFQKNMKNFGKVLKKKLKRLMVAKKLNMSKIFKKFGLILMMICQWIRLLTIIIRCVFSGDGKFVWIIKMRQYKKIDVSEGIDVNKTSASKKFELYHYWYFKDVGFKFEEHGCNGCHDLLTVAHSLENIAILIAKGF